MKETKNIQAWLAARKLTAEAAPASKQPAPTAKNATTVLDENHKAALREILKHSTLSSGELRTLALRFGLMPWACLAKLNEWTTHTFGDLLTEGDENINVNQQLTERIQL